jgi:hypothetical protein
VDERRFLSAHGSERVLTIAVVREGVPDQLLIGRGVEEGITRGQGVNEEKLPIGQ